jgi:hypothetical protein
MRAEEVNLPSALLIQLNPNYLCFRLFNLWTLNMHVEGMTSILMTANGAQSQEGNAVLGGL